MKPSGPTGRWLRVQELPTSRYRCGALLRSGEHARALESLNKAIALHGKPHPLTHNLLALTHFAMGDKEKAKADLAQAVPAKDAPWEDAMLHRLFQPEIEAALARAK